MQGPTASVQVWVNPEVLPNKQRASEDFLTRSEMSVLSRGGPGQRRPWVQAGETPLFKRDGDSGGTLGCTGWAAGVCAVQAWDAVTRTINPIDRSTSRYLEGWGADPGFDRARG